MATVVIEADPMDFRFHREAFEEIVDALRDAGFDASVEVAEFEKRHAVVELVVRLLDDVEGEVVGVLVGVLIGQLKKAMPRRPTRYRRRVVIFGPRGDVVKTVEIEHEGEDEPES